MPAACEPNPEPLAEARGLVELVRLGTETAASARALIRITRSEARFLSGRDILYRAAILREFDRLLPREPRPAAQTPPPPPPPVQIPHAPAPVPHGDILLRVAEHFGTTVEALTARARKGSPRGHLPRWTAALALRTVRHVPYREIAAAVGYAQNSRRSAYFLAYDALCHLEAARRRDPALDARISQLLTSLPNSDPTREPTTPALAAATQQQRERHGTDRLHPTATTAHT